MGSIQSTNNHRKRYRTPSSTKSNTNTKYKRVDRFRTTMRSVTLRALANRNYQNSVSSSYDSTINNSLYTSPTTMTTIHSQLNTDTYLSDFDYRKLSTLTGLSESKVNELHREFLILSDNNGRLTFKKYKSMLDTVPNQKTSAQLDKLARQTFTLFDKDGNNYLDFAEFIAAYIIMERNELCLNDKSQQKESSIRPTLTSVTRQATTYYSPQRTLVNTSPRTTYLPKNYTSYYYPQSSEAYVYASSKYTVR
jgi:hypothetical protein